MKRNAFLAWCEHLIQPAADAHLVDEQRGKQRDMRNLGPKLKDQCNRPDRKWRPDPLTQDAPPRPPLPPRSLPGIRAAPPRAGHDGSYSSPRYTPRAVERCGRRGADYISQQPPRGTRIRSGTRVNKNLPLHSPPRERRCAQPETARGAAGPLGPSQRREAALSGRRHCPPFPSASTASGERRGGIGPCGCDAGREGGREPLFPGTLRGREGGQRGPSCCGLGEAPGPGSGGGGASFPPRVEAELRILPAPRDPGVGTGGGGHHCVAAACYWLAPGARLPRSGRDWVREERGVVCMQLM